jgi:serine/threonine protein kinase
MMRHLYKPATLINMFFISLSLSLRIGVVYKAIDLNTNKHVALKKIRVEIEDEGKVLHSTALDETLLMRLFPY